MIEQQFIEYVVKQLVDHPDEVKIERVDDDRGTLLKLSVAADDLGRVIGRHGATAQSLRSLLRALSIKNNSRFTLKIVDTDQEAASTDDAAGKANDTTTENSQSVDTVENSNPETVENAPSRTEKLRADLAELSDLGI